MNSNMNDALSIRNIIRNILNEAIETPHFKERVIDRLESGNSNFNTESDRIKGFIQENINILKSINFPGQDNIGVLIFNGSKNYKYHRVVNGKTERSEGNKIWIIIRANDLETIVFGDNSYLPQNTEIRLNMKQIRNYINGLGKDKNGQYNLSINDLKRLTKNLSPINIIKPTKTALQTTSVYGEDWYVDKQNQTLINVKDKNNIKNIYDVIGEVDEETAQKILDLLEKS